MRARVEKVDVLGWNKSQVGEEILDPHSQGRLPVRRASAGLIMGDKTQKVHQDPTNLQVEVHTKCSL